MGAGSAKGVKINDEDFDPENDRFSVISHDSAELDPQEAQPGSNHHNKNNSDKKSKVRAKIEALYDESDEEDADVASTAAAPKVAVAVTDEKEDEKKRSLFGFSRRKEEDDKTNVFVHESDDATKKISKKESSKGFKLFSFRKDGKKSEEKDEPLDQEIKDLQRTFDSLGIVGKPYWDDNGPKKGERKNAKKSQSADDIRDLEPMRNRMNQKRRFSRPSNMMTAGGGLSLKRVVDGLTSSSGGNKRTFKYSWELDNNSSSPARSEEWKYEAVVIEGFDIDKFKKANFEESLINGSLSSRIPNSIISDTPPSSASIHSERKSPLVYDATEQRILAGIERDYINY